MNLPSPYFPHGNNINNIENNIRMERRKDHHFRSQYLYESPQDREADLARHAALSVLLDREALMTRALVRQEVCLLYII